MISGYGFYMGVTRSESSTATAKYSVFEVVNERRRQIFVAVTNLPIFATAKVLRDNPPAAIADWREADVTTLRSIEFGLSEGQARKFVDGYVRSALPPGWSFVRDQR